MLKVEAFRDPRLWYHLIEGCFGGLERRSIEDLEQAMNHPSFMPEGLLLAKVDDKPAGMIWVRPLPSGGRYELRDLAVRREHWGRGVEDALIRSAMGLVMERGGSFVRAQTHSIKYYVEAYKRHGFKPSRRILRMVWEVGRISIPTPPSHVEVAPLRMRDIEEIVETFLKALTPYWDWWVEDYGGVESLRRKAAQWFRSSKGLFWLVAKVGGRPVGITGFRTLGRTANFFGAFTHPDHRFRGVGRALMAEVLRRLRELGVERLVVHTVASLEHLEPGAILYLKTGGRIEAEYIHLEKRLA